MKLAEPLKLKNELTPGHYARVLRAIGQDLTNLFPQDLEVELQGNIYIARGHCARKRLEGEQPNDGKRGLMSYFKKLLLRDVQTIFSDSDSQSKPEIVEFTRTYAPEDIDRLDAIGMSHRTGMDRIPDARSLAEALRTIGRLIDANDGHLISLVRNQNRVIVKYRDKDDLPQKEELKHFQLYKLQQRFYKNRSTFKPVDLWTGHDK